MMTTKRSPEEVSGDVKRLKSDKLLHDDRTKTRINESILINPELEEKIVVDEARRSILNTRKHLQRTFKLGNMSLSAPNVVTFTNCGQVPHVTADLCDTDINGDVAVISLHSIMPAISTLEKLGLTISQFIRTKNKIILNPFNSSEPCDMTSFNDSLNMSMWGRGGRRKVTSKEYCQFVKTCSPDVFVSLSDVVPSSVNKKRANKSCYRTLQWVNEAITFKSDNDLPSCILAPIPGSGHRQLVMKSAKLLATRDVDGFVLERCTLPLIDWQELVKDVVSILPPDKPVFMLGVLNELELLEAYSCGCHFVDSSFVTHYANSGHSLALDYSNPLKIAEHINIGDTQDNSNKDFGPSLAENIPKQEPNTHNHNKKEKGRTFLYTHAHYIPTTNTTLDLRSQTFTKQFIPLVEGCTCFTCTRHTRGYVNHLLITNELLGPTLLMLHNLNRVRKLVREAEKRVENGKLKEFVDAIRNVYS